MRRVQILLDGWQYQRLRSAAERGNRSISSVVREAVSQFFGESSPKAADTLADIGGLAADAATRGRDHDDVLYGPRRKRS